VRAKKEARESHLMCCNLSFGLATKSRAYKVVGQKGSPGVMPHALGNVGKCEGMNPHTSKGTSTLGVEVPVDSQNFRER
jgi:hypothetical protein